MLVVTHLATPIAVATACEFSSCVTCAGKEDMRPGEWRSRYERCWKFVHTLLQTDNSSSTKLL
jgi:hypothetical protein